jgi:hypothetical protein
MHESYSPEVNSKRNVLLVLILAVAAIGTGCSGVNAGGSVSPATFLLPGLGHHSPKPPAAEVPSQEAPSLEDSPALSVYAASVVQ